MTTSECPWGGSDGLLMALVIRREVSVGDAIMWRRDDHEIVTLTIDDPDQRVNTLNRSFTESFASVLDRLERERDRIRGVILRSGKDSFLAGADLKRLMAVRASDRMPSWPT